MGFMSSSVLKNFFGKLMAKLSSASVRRGRDSDAVGGEEVVVDSGDLVQSQGGGMKPSQSTLAPARDARDAWCSSSKKPWTPSSGNTGEVRR